MPFVFDFDHAHRKPPMEMKDLLGGKGANLAEMTSVLELPVPPGFTIATTACRDYMDGRLARRADRRGGQGQGPAREEDGQADRRPERPAAGVGAVGGQVLHARDDGHRPQPGPQRPVGRGPGQADRRRAVRLRLLPPVRGHVRAHRARHPRRRVRLPARRGQGAGRHRIRRRYPHRAAPLPGRRLPADRRAPHRQAVPPGPRRPAARGHRGRLRLVERSAGHRLPGAGADRPRPRHRGQRPGHGVRQPRRHLGDRRGLHP